LQFVDFLVAYVPNRTENRLIPPTYDFLIGQFEKTCPINNLKECYPTANNQLYVTYMDLNCRNRWIYMCNLSF